MRNKTFKRINRPHTKPKLSGQAKRKKIFRNSLKFIGGIIILIIVAFLWFSRDLPTISNLDSKVNAPSTQIFDRSGKLLYAISGNKKSFPIKFKDIPDNVKNATISLEDQTFYKNHGIVFTSIARSAIVDIVSHKKSQGGSTITQQFVKNALLTSNKSFTRKIKEVILAIEVDSIYSKDQILGYYLNEIPYGGNIYGIEAASRTYFGKSAKDLDLAQAATLAALPNAPTYYSPYGPNVDALMKRKDLALNRMSKNKYITQKQADEAKAEKITFQPQKDSIIAPHFVFYVEQVIANKYGEAALRNGGLKITTTLDLDAQNNAQKAIDDNASELDRHKADNAGLVAVDPKTGQILAMVGSRDYFNNKIDGQVNVTTSDRQPGSSFKPIVYATAFKGKYNPAYPLFDLTTDFNGYAPRDYDLKNRGPVTIRTALSNSLNIPAVKILSLVGIDNALKTAKDLGITSLNEPSRYGLSLVLGGAEVPPLQMAGAYSVFANNGQYNPTTSILKVQQGSKVLQEYKKSENKQVLDPQVAFLISDILDDKETRKMEFGNLTNNLTIAGHQAAAKTGTTQDFHDGWTVGYTPQISTAVWAGNTDNSPMRSGSAGLIVAAPIWKAFMTSYLKDKPNVNFPIPDGVQKTTVDFLSNKKATDSSPQDQLRTDYFASWNIPKDNDDVHIKFNINKINGKLATDQTPPELIQEKTCTDVHSARPDVAAWENPVRAWADANNLTCSKPTAKDDSYSSLNDSPIVTITSPKNKDELSNQFTITTEAAAKHGVKSVEFKLDDKSIGVVTSKPYNITVKPNSYTQDKHILSAIITDNNGVSSNSSNQVNITFVKPTTLVISLISVSQSAPTATVTWRTNLAADSDIKYGLTQSTLQDSGKDTHLVVNHSMQITGIVAGQKYYYQIYSTDSSGNTAKSPIQSFNS